MDHDSHHVFVCFSSKHPTTCNSLTTEWNHGWQRTRWEKQNKTMVNTNRKPLWDKGRTNGQATTLFSQVRRSSCFAKPSLDATWWTPLWSHGLSMANQWSRRTSMSELCREHQGNLWLTLVFIITFEIFYLFRHVIKLILWTFDPPGGKETLLQDSRLHLKAPRARCRNIKWKCSKLQTKSYLHVYYS